MPLTTPEELRRIPAEGSVHLPPLLRALWHEAHGDWAASHETAQNIDTPDAAWVHAYLHRKEGDLTNASYWYRRAGKSPATGPLPAEWDAIASALLNT